MGISWWWMAGLLGLVLVVATMIIGYFLLAMDHQRRERTLREGEPVLGWLVMANANLFEAGRGDYPALAAISPEDEVGRDEKFMMSIVYKLQDIREKDKKDLQGDDYAMLKSFLSDESYVQGARFKLPKRMTDGKAVFVAHVYVFRRDLPAGRITASKKLYCQIIWRDVRAMICTRPPTRDELQEDLKRREQAEDSVGPGAAD